MVFMLSAKCTVTMGTVHHDRQSKGRCVKHGGGNTNVCTVKEN